MSGVIPLLLIAASAQPAATSATVPTQTCPTAGSPTIRVHVEGFANRSGTVRVRLFGPPTSSYFDKRHALRRIEEPVPQRGPVYLCVAAPGPGVYAIDVRHDVNGNGKTDRSDGGGASGNPHLSLFDVVFGRRPDPAAVQFRVDRPLVDVDVRLMYLRGTTFKSIGDP